MKKFLFALCIMLISSGAAFAADTMPGDVIAIFKNTLDVPVTAESLAQGGAHYQYIHSVADELNATVRYIYEALSTSNNEIMALIHTDSKSENDLWFELRMRPDVKGASLNYVRRINIMKNSNGAR